MIGKLMLLLPFLFFLGCPAKKEEPKKEDTKDAVADNTVTKDSEIKADADSSLDDVIYDAVGRSTSKNEMIARDKAELLARAALVKVLAKDAHELIKNFSSVEKSVFSSGVDGEAFGKKVEETMIKDTKLRGSKISESTRSANKDTMLVTIEISLMGGYETMEHAIIDVGQKEKYLSDVDNFRKLFRQFFTAQKKKTLTEPS